MLKSLTQLIVGFGAAMYAILPFDLDFIPVIGWVDDVLVVIGAVIVILLLNARGTAEAILSIAVGKEQGLSRVVIIMVLAVAFLGNHYFNHLNNQLDASVVTASTTPFQTPPIENSDEALEMASVAIDTMPSPAPITELTVTVESAILRECPNTNCKPVDNAKQYEILIGIREVTGRSVAGSTSWWQIEHEDGDAYIHASLVEATDS